VAGVMLRALDHAPDGFGVAAPHLAALPTHPLAPAAIASAT